MKVLEISNLEEEVKALKKAGFIGGKAHIHNGYEISRNTFNKILKKKDELGDILLDYHQAGDKRKKPYQMNSFEKSIALLYKVVEAGDKKLNSNQNNLKIVKTPIHEMIVFNYTILRCEFPKKTFETENKSNKQFANNLNAYEEFLTNMIIDYVIGYFNASKVGCTKDTILKCMDTQGFSKQEISSMLDSMNYDYRVSYKRFLSEKISNKRTLLKNEITRNKALLEERKSLQINLFKELQSAYGNSLINKKNGQILDIFEEITAKEILDIEIFNVEEEIAILEDALDNARLKDAILESELEKINTDNEEMIVKNQTLGNAGVVSTRLVHNEFKDYDIALEVPYKDIIAKCKRPLRSDLVYKGNIVEIALFSAKSYIEDIKYKARLANGFIHVIYDKCDKKMKKAIKELKREGIKVEAYELDQGNLKKSMYQNILKIIKNVDSKEIKLKETA